MLFSVIVPTCNRPQDLGKCLSRLAPGEQSLQASQYEVIVTDDGKDDSGRHLVQEQYPWVRWVQGPKRGPAPNRNHGAGLAEADWIVFCDDDCLPEQELLEAYVQALASDPNASVLEGRISANRPKERADEVAPINEKGGLLWSCNFAIRRDVFHMMKGFDEEYPCAQLEDVDLRLRLEARGIGIRFVPKAGVIHPWRRHGGRAAVEKSVCSYAVFWRKQPRVFATMSPWFFVHLCLRICLKDIPKGLFQHRGRGLSALGWDLVQAVRLARLSAIMRAK